MQAVLFIPRQPPIAFFWATANDSVKTIPQCGTLQVFTTPSPTTSVQPVGPFYFTAAAQGYVPETQLVTQQIGGAFNWTANYAVGTQLLFAMTDSANNSGGAVDGYTVIPGSDSCELNSASNSPAWLNVATYPDNNPCSEIDFDLTVGKAPFTVSILVPQSGAYLNATGIDKKSFTVKNIVPAGQSYNFWVTDSEGASSYTSFPRTSQLNQSSCSEAVRPGGDSSTSVGTVVGAVIGSVLGALVIAGVAWWFVRRRNRQRAERYRQQPPAATSEFRTADGRAPLVEPFRIPMAGAAAGGGAAAGDTFDDHSPNADSFEKGLYPLSPDQHYRRDGPPSAGVVPAPPPPSHLYDPSAHPYGHAYDPYDHASYTATAASASAAGGHGYDPVASSSPADTTEYLSPSSAPGTSYLGEHQQHQQHGVRDDAEAPAGDGTDGLAHPGEFEYRLPGESPTGPAGPPRPWAQQQGAMPYGHRPY
ncbi:hypothetical protein JCM3775_002381 [Rhodotorula graminis]